MRLLHLATATATLLVSTVLFAADPSTDRSNWVFSDARMIPIQSGGRIKPLDSFAREAILNFTGSTTFRGADPVEQVFSMMAYPEYWQEQQFIQVGRIDLKRQLGLEETRKRFSPKELFSNTTLGQYAERMGGQDQSKIIGDGRADAREQEFRRLVSRLTQFRDLIAGTSWAVIPQPAPKQWISLQEHVDTGKIIRGHFFVLVKAFQTGDQSGFERAAKLARTEVEAAVPDFQKTIAPVISAETLYNRIHPFKSAWVLYLASALLWVLSFSGKGRRAALIFTLAAFSIHVFGFALRCYVAGRPPVTNMYESIVWVMFGVMVFAGILYSIHKQAVVLVTACAVSAIGLIAADAAPAMMDPGIHPLVPVLRSNYWLTIHVLTITLGYAAFALSLGLGNVTLWHYLRKGTGWMAKANEMNQLTYRSMQFGVVLLAAGTILGGIWADYSWGRFWGWDPKETWALIALLCYLAVLHGRFTQWIGSFAFAATSVISFLAVLMAWYGVNFILGAGLHSYGFSSGGLTWVVGYTIVQLGYVLFVAFKHEKSKSASAAAQS